MNIQQFSSPQILSGTVSLTSGQTQTVTLESMASRSHRWLRLDELSLVFYMTPSATTYPNQSQMMGSVVGVRARAYRQDLMLNYVPTWLLGPRLHVGAEIYPNSTAPNVVNYGSLETYRWKFPKPFFLPPGAAFVTQLQRSGSAADLLIGGTMNAQVVVRAVQMGEKEVETYLKGKNGVLENPIPYIASYAPTSFPNKSNNLDLANPFLVPLHLQRMTARVYSTATGGSPYGIKYGTSVKLSDTRTVICEWSELFHIFPTTQMAWTHKRVIQPTEYITAELSTNVLANTYPQVAIIGYRNEVLS